MKNTRVSSIVCFTILVLPVLFNFVPVSCIYNTGIPESLIYAQYRKLQYSSSNNTGKTSIVKHTILEAPEFFIQQIEQYW
jgi:hypothetical protein